MPAAPPWTLLHPSPTHLSIIPLNFHITDVMLPSCKNLFRSGTAKSLLKFLNLSVSNPPTPNPSDFATFGLPTMGVGVGLPTDFPVGQLMLLDWITGPGRSNHQ